MQACNHGNSNYRSVYVAMSKQYQYIHCGDVAVGMPRRHSFDFAIWTDQSKFKFEY